MELLVLPAVCKENLSQIVYYSFYIIALTITIFQWFCKIRCVRFELFSINNVATETWMCNVVFDQISKYIIVFVCKIFIAVIKFSESFQ